MPFIRIFVSRTNKLGIQSICLNTRRAHPQKRRGPAWAVLGLLALAAAAAGSSPAGDPPAPAGPQVSTALYFAVTPPVRELPTYDINTGPMEQIEKDEPLRLPKADYARQRGLTFKDEALNDTRAASLAGAMPAATTFAGQGNTICGCQPPDPNGDVGPSHYVQVVNTGFAVYNKSGTALKSSTSLKSLWSSMAGSQCASTNSGDPIVLYDRAADRWMISQFSLSPQYHQCIAVSQTADPTGSWYTWDFLWSTTVMNDYPHFGVWPDGYYMSVNQFTGGTTWAGQGTAVFERSAMLTGSTGARMVKFDVGSGTSSHNLDYGGQLPSDMDGASAPPAGMPNLFMEADDAAFPGATQAALRIWKFHVDWTNTANSTYGVGTTAHDPDFAIPCANFNYMPNCGTSSSPNGYCIPQKGTSSYKIDDLGDRIMYRLAYRNFGSYESLVTSLTVDAGSQRAGIRWWELRNVSTAPAIHQESTYAPTGTLHRWLGSVAMNKAGDLAIGYSGSDANTTYPSLLYSGRFEGDALNNLSQGEATMYAGTTYFSGHRWGDYSALKAAPSDDCTFWYTNEYATSTHDWTTRVGHFLMTPAAPSAPSFSGVGCGGLTVSWAASPGAATYDVYRKSGTSCTGAAKINTSPVTGTSFADSGLSANSAYSYYVVGSDACGVSPAGTCASQTTAAGPAAPAAPGFSGVLCTTLNLAWSAVSGATGYDVYRKTGSSCTGAVKINASTVTGTAYSDSGLTSGGTYSYFIVAQSSCGASPNGSCNTQTTQASCLPPGEDAPGTSSSTGQNWSDKDTPTWLAVDDATSYTLYRGVPADLPKLLNAQTDSCTVYSGPATSAVDASSPVSVTGRYYWYLVTASNANGEGPAGNATSGARTVNSGGTCP